MNAPQIIYCQSFSDLPAPRAGGVAYILRTGLDGGLGGYLSSKGFTVQDALLAATADDYVGITLRNLPSATRLVVAIGGYYAMEAGKLLAHSARLPLWCVPTDYDAASALTDYSLWTVDNRPVFLPAPALTVIRLPSAFAATRDGVQQAYQHLFGYYVALEAAIFRNRLFLNEGDNARLRETHREVERTLLAVDEYAPTLGETLWTVLVKAAETCEDKEIILLAKAICVYKKGNMAYNRYVFAAAYAYLVALGEWQDAPDLLLPPDRTLVLKEAEAKLGWRVALEQTESGQEYRRIDWVWRDRVEELGEALNKAKRMAKIWRRLAGSAGFGYFEDLAAEDMTSLLPIVAETYPSYTPFKHLYLRGGLNLFI